MTGAIRGTGVAEGGKGPVDAAAGRAHGARMSKVLSKEEIAAALPAPAGWIHEATAAGDRLAKTYRFATFRDALAFMVRAGFAAEALDHHPEWTNVYNRVAVRLNTHDAGGRVTAKDVELAGRLDAAAGGVTARAGN